MIYTFNYISLLYLVEGSGDQGLVVLGQEAHELLGPELTEIVLDLRKTNSMGLYCGEYGTLYTHLKPLSRMASFAWSEVCAERLSMKMTILSSGLASHSFSFIVLSSGLGS